MCNDQKLKNSMLWGPVIEQGSSRERLQQDLPFQAIEVEEEPINMAPKNIAAPVSPSAFVPWKSSDRGDSLATRYHLKLDEPLYRREKQSCLKSYKKLLYSLWYYVLSSWRWKSQMTPTALDFWFLMPELPWFATTCMIYLTLPRSRVMGRILTQELRIGYWVFHAHRRWSCKE